MKRKPPQKTGQGQKQEEKVSRVSRREGERAQEEQNQNIRVRMEQRPTTPFPRPFNQSITLTTGAQASSNQVYTLTSRDSTPGPRATSTTPLDLAEAPNPPAVISTTSDAREIPTIRPSVTITRLSTNHEVSRVSRREGERGQKERNQNIRVKEEPRPFTPLHHRFNQSLTLTIGAQASTSQVYTSTSSDSTPGPRETSTTPLDLVEAPNPPAVIPTTSDAREISPTRPSVTITRHSTDHDDNGQELLRLVDLLSSATAPEGSDSADTVDIQDLPWALSNPQVSRVSRREGERAQEEQNQNIIVRMEQRPTTPFPRPFNQSLTLTTGAQASSSQVYTSTSRDSTPGLRETSTTPLDLVKAPNPSTVISTTSDAREIPTTRPSVTITRLSTNDEVSRVSRREGERGQKERNQNIRVKEEPRPFTPLHHRFNQSLTLTIGAQASSSQVYTSTSSDSTPGPRETSTTPLDLVEAPNPPAVIPTTSDAREISPTRPSVTITRHSTDHDDNGQELLRLVDLLSSATAPEGSDSADTVDIQDLQWALSNPQTQDGERNQTQNDDTVTIFGEPNEGAFSQPLPHSSPPSENQQPSSGSASQTYNPPWEEIRRAFERNSPTPIPDSTSRFGPRNLPPMPPLERIPTIGTRMQHFGRNCSMPVLHPYTRNDSEMQPRHWQQIQHPYSNTAYTANQRPPRTSLVLARVPRRPHPAYDPYRQHHRIWSVQDRYPNGGAGMRPSQFRCLPLAGAEVYPPAYPIQPQPEIQPSVTHTITNTFQIPDMFYRRHGWPTAPYGTYGNNITMPYPGTNEPVVRRPMNMPGEHASVVWTARDPLQVHNNAMNTPHLTRDVIFGTNFSPPQGHMALPGTMWFVNEFPQGNHFLNHEPNLNYRNDEPFPNIPPPGNEDNHQNHGPPPHPDLN